MGKARIKLFASFSALVLVGLLGAVPVFAQDESPPASEDAEGDAAGEMTADELLAKALAFINAIHEEGASHPPIRIESRQHFGNHYEGELPPELQLPDYELTGTGFIDSLGNTQYSMTIVPDSRTERELTSQEQSAYETIVDFPHSRHIGDTLYSATKLIALQGWPLDDATPWLALDTSQFLEQSLSDRFVRLMTTSPSTPDTFADVLINVPGNDEYIKAILDRTKSSQAVERSNIRGHDTTRFTLRLQVLDALAIHLTQVFETVTLFDVLGYKLTQPDPTLAALIFSPDSLIDVEMWVDDEGRVHRTFTDVSPVFSRYFIYLLDTDIDLDEVRESFEYSYTVDLTYLEEDPVIEPPPAAEVTEIDDIGRYLNDLREQFMAERQESQSEEADDGLPRTGVNTPLLVIVGLAAIASGAMVVGFSRRLRSRSLM